jgi:fructose-1-phosphate kinase PfkB-like protein
MNIKRKLTKKVAVAFSDAPLKPVVMPRPAFVKPNAPPVDFKNLFNRLRKTTK